MQAKYYIANKSRTYSHERVSTDSKPEQPSVELKVCEDCQVRHSTAGHDHDHDHDHHNHYASYNSRGLHRDEIPTHPSQDFKYTGYSSSQNPEKDYFPRKQYSSGYDSKQTSAQERPYFTFEQNERNNWREGSTIGKAEGTFGYNGSHRNRSSVKDESPIRKSERSNNSYIDTSGAKDYDERRAREEIERERVKLEQYSKELNKSLENLSVHLDNSLKRDFDNAAYSLLKKKASPNKENDFRRNNVFTSETDEFAEKSFDHQRREEKSYISDYYPTENEHRITPATSKQARVSDSKRKLATPLYKTEEYSDVPQEDQSKKASIANSTERKKIKAYRDIKRHVDTEENFQSGSDKKVRPVAHTLSADLREAAEEYMSGNRSVSIQKLNEKLKKNSKPAKPAEKKERFLLSPPKEQVGSTFRKFQDIQNTDDEEYQQDPTGDGYEDEEYQPRESEAEIDRIREKELRDQQAREDEYLDSLPVEAQIKELEEFSIQAIREGNYELALEKLVRCEQVIRGGLAAHDPQQIYIQYLLGECYLKLEEFDEAQGILERAINNYEVNEYHTYNSHVYTYYYLGLLLLLGHLYMVCRSFSKAIVIYNKLIRGIQSYNDGHSNNKLLKTIPHILLIKYNLGESYRNLDKFEQTDEIFNDVLYKFSMQNEEHLDNYTILLSIAEYFISRQRMDAALEALIKISEVNQYRDIQGSDPELFCLIYDEIASIFFSRGEYLEAGKFYEYALKIKVKMHGMKHPKVGFGLLALGKAYYLAGEHGKAFNKLSSGIDVIESLEGRNNVYSANTCILMAKIKFEIGDAPKAIGLYERGLEIYTILFGLSHSYCLKIYINLIHLCFSSHNMPKLGQVVEKAVKALDESNSQESFAVLNEIGNIYRKNACNEQAVHFYQKAIKKFEDVDRGEMDPEQYYHVYFNLGIALTHTRKYGDALNYLQQASHFFEKINKGQNRSSVQVMINLARIYKILHKSTEASIYLNKAGAIVDALEKRGEEVKGLRNDIKVLMKPQIN